MAKGNFIEYVVSDDPNKYPNGSVQGGYYYEKVVKSTATSVPTDLIPEIVCADNHLRDIVIEDGVAYARVGFYHRELFDMNFTVTKDLTVDKLIIIGCGGYGGLANDTNGGGPGGTGELKQINNYTLTTGNYKVFLYSNGNTVLFKDSTELYRATCGVQGTDGAGKLVDSSSSADATEGNEGFYTELMGSTQRGWENTMRTGYGLGGGGCGSGMGERLLDNSVLGMYIRKGNPGGVLIYVRL